MSKKKLYLILQALLCVLLAILLAAAVLGAYREGLAERSEQPSAPLFTKEALASRLRPVVPLLIAAAVSTGAGLALGVRDEGADRGVNTAAPTVTPSAGGARRLRLLLLAAALGLILLGIWNGGAHAVFAKAARICTECIGLG